MSLLAPPRQTIAPKRPCGRRRPEQATSLAAYTTPENREREILCTPGANASTLVIDRDLMTRTDERLLARIHPEEPQENARVVCDLYLAERPARRYCRPVTPQDRDASAPPTRTPWVPGDAWTLLVERIGLQPGHPSLA